MTLKPPASWAPRTEFQAVRGPEWHMAGPNCNIAPPPPSLSFQIEQLNLCSPALLTSPPRFTREAGRHRTSFPRTDRGL